MYDGFTCNSFLLLDAIITDIQQSNDTRTAPIIILDYNKNFLEYRHKLGFIYFSNPSKFNFNAFINVRFNARRRSDPAFIICDDLKAFNVDIHNYCNRQQRANVILYGYSRKKPRGFDFIDTTKE